MASLVSRLVACLVAVVAILQLVHLVLLNKLESRRLTELHHLQHQQNYPGENTRLPVSILGDEGTSDLLSFPGDREGENNHPPLHPNYEADADAAASSGHSHQNSNGYGSQARTRTRRVEHGHANVNKDNVPENELLADRLFREEDGAVIDSAGEYRIVFDVARPKPEIGTGSINNLNKHSNNNDDFSIDDEIFEAESSVDVTLVTQSDLENGRRYLLPLVHRWEGPISIALFASNSSGVEATLEFITQARLCSELIEQYVTFHLVFPFVETHSSNKKTGLAYINKTRINTNNNSNRKNSRKKKQLSLRVDPNSKECQYFIKDSTKSPKTSSSSSSERSFNNYEGSTVYPTNLLRNIARKRVQTDFSLVTDIDTLPSQGLRSKFQKFARDKELLKPNGDEKKSVFVVPAFESKNGEAPGSKRELLSLIDKYQARPFYFDLCWKCQVHTDYETWQREQRGGSSRKDDELSVLFEVLWKDPWEPFFISDASVPLFDERFRQQGFNRISQLCELHVAGYKFAVLNEAFLIHRGYITPPPFHPKRARDLDTNRAHFRQFKTELKIKYPHSTRRCY